MLYLLLAALCVAIDQGTKLLALAKLSGAGEVEVLPGIFHLHLSMNSGASLGIFSGQRWLLVGLSAVAVAFMVWIIATKKFRTRGLLLGISLVLGGAAGNLVDRALRGEVVDMIFFPWIGKIPLLPDFICNMADIFLSFGAVIFIVFYAVEETRRAREESQNEA